MKHDIIFDSLTAPIPRIRSDLDVIPVQNNGDSYLYFHDMRGYVTPDFALGRSAGTILQLLDGRKSVNDLKPYLGNGVNTGQLLQYIQFLDQNRLLHSPHFEAHAQQVEADYEQSDVHHSTTAGRSYPDDPNELRAFLDEAFEQHTVPDEINSEKNPKALYAPHIDPRVGMKSYVQSFQRLKRMRPKRVVILATSHYSGLYPETYQNTPFIVSRKDFAMPMGTVPADREVIDQLMQNNTNTGLTDRDRAHRIEHSIELHLLFLQYIWTHNFSIVPIVVGGFDELFYMDQNQLSQQVDAFSTLLNQQFGNDDETFFLISGDLAHTGKKFGDEQPALALKDEVEQFDQQFLEHGINGSIRDILQLMKRNYDPYRICGFPPLYTFLSAFPGMKGRQLSYQRWDETERESAVTFGSILYQ